MTPIACLILYGKGTVGLDTEDLILTLLYLSKGTTEITLILVHNWSLHKDNERLTRVLSLPVLQLSTAKPLLISLFLNMNELLFVAYIFNWDTDNFYPTSPINVCVNLLNHMATIVLLQFTGIVGCIARELREETVASTEVHEKARRVNNLMEVARDVDILYRKTNLGLCARGVGNTLYSMYQVLNNKYSFYKVYRGTNACVYLVSLFMLINASQTFHKEVKTHTHRAK